MKHLALILLAVSLVTSLGLLASAKSPAAARLVRASVVVDGEVVLRTSTSDDGSPDADEVWGYLRGLEFEATPEFASLAAARKAEGDDGSFELLGTAVPERGKSADGGPYRRPEIGLSISYGGEVELRKVRFVPAATAGKWRLDKGVVERWFGLRMIAREWAVHLDKPRRRNF